MKINIIHFKNLLIILAVSTMSFSAFSQMQDSISYYLNGIEQWFFQQPDVLSFRYDNRSAYTTSYDTSIIDKVEYFGHAEGVNNIYFNSSATLWDKQQVYNSVSAQSGFEKFFIVPVRGEHVNEPYGKNYWMGTDMSINIIFDNPNITQSTVQAFAANYELEVIFSPDPSIKGGVHVLQAEKWHTVLDYYSPSLTAELCVKMWENDSSMIKTLAPSLRLFHPHIPNDSLLADQWWARDNIGYTCLDTTISNNASIDLDCAWNYDQEFNSGPSYSGDGIVVGVINFHGIEFTHPDMTGQFLDGYICASPGNNPLITPVNYNIAPVLAAGGGLGAHLQNVSGVIAAKANNNEGSAGVAFNSKIIPCLTQGTTAQFNALAMKLLAEDGDRQVDIINMSFGIYGLTHQQAEALPFYFALENCAQNGRPITNGNARGIVLVASVGNDNQANHYGDPAGFDFVLSVGATNPYDQRKSSGDGFSPGGGPSDWGSNYYNYMDVSAPGICVTTTDHTDSAFFGYIGKVLGNYYSFKGTSASAPIVAGIAALVLEKDSTLSRIQVYEAIRLSCDKVGGYTYSNNGPNGRCAELGFGRVNACSALNILSVLGNDKVIKIFDVKHNTTVYNNLKITLDQARKVFVEIYSITGQQVFFQNYGSQSDFNINLENQADGLYVLKIIDENSKDSYTAKIIKQ